MDKDVKNGREGGLKLEKKNDAEEAVVAQVEPDSLTDLLTGIVVVVDDNLGDGKDKMNQVLANLKSIGFPVLEFTSLPTQEIKHFKNPAFLVLDWELDDFSKLGSEAKKGLIEENIEFIRSLKEVTFCPIFIFSNVSPENIAQKLEEADLYDGQPTSNIFIQSKSDVDTEEKVTAQILEWYKINPSIYLTTKWKNSLSKAENDLYWDFIKIDPKWPNVIAKAYNIDGTDSNYEFSAFLNRNLISRFSSLDLDFDIISGESEDISKDQVRNVSEGERYIKDIEDTSVGVGDLFKESYDDQGTERFRYFINIRPNCDTLRHKKGNPEIYLLKGRIVDESKINSSDHESPIPFSNGSFVERANSTYVMPVDSGKMIEFLFKDLKIEKWKEFSDKRIGRILPPYSTKIQQRYSYYLQRQGLPGKPSEIISTPTNSD